MRRCFLDAALFLFLSAIYLLFAPGHLFTVDSVEVYRTAESLVRDHDLAIERPYPLAGVDTKHFYSKYGVGQVIAVLPLYLVGEVVAGCSWGRSFFVRTYAEGFGGDPRIFFVSLFNVFVTAATALLVLRCCMRLGYRARTGLWVAWIYGLATLAFPHSRDFFQHPLTTWMLFFAFHALLVHRRSGGSGWLLLGGMALGYGMLTRPISVVAWPVHFALLAHAWRKEGGRGKRLREAAAFLLPLMGAFCVQLAYNHARYGSPFTFGYFSIDDRPGFSTPLYVGLYGYLFSPGRSIFLYSPPLIAALLAFPAFLRRCRVEGYALLSIFLLFLGCYATWHVWDGGWCWGPRYLLQSLPFLLLPLAETIESGSRQGRFFLALCVGAGVFVQVPGVLIDYNEIFWKWRQMALQPADAYLFHPGISPIVEHWRAIVAGRPLDLWLLDRKAHLGALPFGVALGILLTVALLALLLAWRASRPDYRS
ncbi:MAG: hypothetical protein D6812_16035 [Deltaproteobacteria bacterium]|nr:MAG: hypothetical protein D6812_16035 [Deltaproteobacteria bacterium]